MNMTRTLIALLTLALFFTSPLALDAKKPSDDDDPSAAGELYGDLYVIERDGNGAPITREISYEAEGDTVVVDCKQPLAADCSMLPLWGDCQGVGVLPLDCEFDPEVNDACEVYEDYHESLQEVSFGRASVTRSQPFVLDSAYAEVLRTFNSASAIEFDPAGRPMAISLEGEKTIDAPLGNLSLYREVMTNGCLGSVIDEQVGEGGVVTEITVALEESAIDLVSSVAPSLICPYDSNGDPSTPDPDGVSVADMMHATGFLAGALDKSEPFRLDELINLNTYLQINSWEYVQDKKNRNLTILYFLFQDDESGDFTYDREVRFSSDETAELLVYQDTGAFFIDSLLYLFDANSSSYPFDRVDLAGSNLTVCRDGYPYPVVCDSAAADAYDPDNGLYGCGGANWFTQAVEHSRKTIWYLHNWAPPELID
jgi:hypothetical protein